MGMVAEYVRMTPVELERALADPEWAEEFTDDLLEGEFDAVLDGEVTEADRRGYDVDKTWDAMRILLHRAAPFETCPFLGGTPFGEVWSYDRPRALTVEQVRSIAEGLGAVAFDRLLDAFDEGALAGAYLGPWDRDGVEMLREHYDGLVRYFAAAAQAGHGMIAYLG
ncbi:YfbM family protein [Thermomonospora cellulosilytica]|uniref:DUF1877 family protein n=1 Tax=Thermomonospora cellulosilytica TaxID=1411118 RepID=A0A7W3MV10_9ACTN|nr:YfbM family protein [Thermomonospora cellulosilytica]MBA9002395.1 hypothetical protein [Thermomonospora cellulosilytica]